MGEFTTIALSISLICLTWAVVKINEKLESTMNRLKRFERQAPPPASSVKTKDTVPAGKV